MDFVTGLPLSNGSDAIWVVVDRLTKMRDLIPSRTTIDAPSVADLFQDILWKHHGLPLTIRSDRGQQFPAGFWGTICRRLKINQRLSTESHPVTDTQTAQVNGVMEQYPRSYVNYQEDDGYQWLPLAEVRGNNQASETTGTSFFFANYGYDPRVDFSTSKLFRLTTKRQVVLLSLMTELHAHLRTVMGYAQERYQENAVRCRLSPPCFQARDKVWLKAKRITIRRPSRKGDDKRQGPYEVKEKIGKHAYCLDLPNTKKIGNVFHVSLLDQTGNNAREGQIILAPLRVEVEGEEEGQVQEVCDFKFIRNRLRYLVKWEGYDEAIWELAESITELKPVDEFHE